MSVVIPRRLGTEEHLASRHKVGLSMLALRTSIRLGTNRLLPLLAAAGPSTSLLHMSSRAASDPGPVELTIQEKVCMLPTHSVTFAFCTRG